MDGGERKGTKEDEENDKDDKGHNDVNVEEVDTRQAGREMGTKCTASTRTWPT